MLVAGAVELSPEGKPRRIRTRADRRLLRRHAQALAYIRGRRRRCSTSSRTDGPATMACPTMCTRPKVVGKMAAHIILRWTPSSSFQTSRDGRSGPTMASVASTSGVTSTSSSSGGTVAATQPWRSIPCSASVPASRQQPPATSSRQRVWRTPRIHGATPAGMRDEPSPVRGASNRLEPLPTSIRIAQSPACTRKPSPAPPSETSTSRSAGTKKGRSLFPKYLLLKSIKIS